MRAFEALVATAVLTRYAGAARYREQLELIHTAWQVVLCAKWESQTRAELAVAAERMVSSDLYARSEGTA